MTSTGQSEDERRALAAIALACLDLTELSEGATGEKIEALCKKAVGPHGAVAAVCVDIPFVRLAKQALGESGVKVATVVNFPEGDLPIGQVEKEISQALENGADEIDAVIPWRAFSRGETMAVAGLVGAARIAAPPPIPLKAILETGALGEARLISRAADMAIAAGADFIKTSTGKSPVGATPDAAKLMLAAIKASHRPVGLKVSGGVRRFADAAEYMALAQESFGVVTPQNFRIGASGLLAELEAVLEGRTPPSETDGY